MLDHLVERSTDPSRWRRLFADLREGLGRNRTVWGVHRGGGQQRVSLHVHLRGPSSRGPHRDRRDELPEPVTWSRVREALSSSFGVFPAVPSHAPVSTVSVVLDDDRLASGQLLRLRIRLPGGLIWRLGPDGVEHDGQLRLFDLHDVTQLRELVEHQTNGLLHASACGVDLQTLLPPALYDCRTVALGTGRHTESVTFAGVSPRALAWALEQHGWPERTRRFLAEHAADLSHLRWDVGLEYCAREGLRWVGSGIYGTL